MPFPSVEPLYQAILELMIQKLCTNFLRDERYRLRPFKHQFWNIIKHKAPFYDNTRDLVYKTPLLEYLNFVGQVVRGKGFYWKPNRRDEGNQPSTI